MEGIAKWIEKRSYITPQRIALIGEQRSLNYMEMNQEVTRLSRMLAEKYLLEQGDRIGILAANSIEYVLLLFAAAKLGVVTVVLNLRLTPRELDFQVNDSGIRLLIAEAGIRTEVEQVIDKMNVEHVLWFEQAESSPLSLQGQVSAYSAENYESGLIDGSAPFIICYTSGTTGRPKGAVLTQENMFWNAVNNCLAIDITSTDRFLMLLPLFHIGGIGLFTLPVLFAGGTVMIPSRFEPEKALRWIEDYKVTIMMGVPTIYDALRKSTRFDQTDLSSIHWLITGGAPCPHELIAFYLERGITFAQGYGMTEASPTVFLTSREDYGRKIGTIGKPVMFCDIRIVDDQRNDVPAGEAGELLIKGPNVIQQYWNLPEATSTSIQDGWFATGDLVKRDDEGFVYIVGRKKDMIISGGENIYPLEVEQVIHELTAVEEEAVFGIPDEKWGEVPIAVIVVKPDMELTEAAVKGHCQHLLAKYKVPAHVCFVSALPKNATGKIDKAALKIQFMPRKDGGRKDG